MKLTTVTISVTAADIASGARYACTCCPIAIAMSRVLGRRIFVGLVSWENPGMDAFGGTLPAFASVFIKEFEMRRPVSPFSFTVKAPAKWIGGAA